MIYVMSDIHGNLRRFRSVMKQIKLQPEDTLYVLGDVIDRYPDGIRILRQIMAMSNAKMLLGNHEYMMLRALGRPYDNADQMDDWAKEDARYLWYSNGGHVTHQYWKRIRKNLREEIIQYLHSLPLNYDVDVYGTHYTLVHGAPLVEHDTFSYRYSDLTYYAVWKRWQKYDRQNGDYTLIFGHTPTLQFAKIAPMKIWYGSRRIGIDCGSGYPEDSNSHYSKYGRLACLRLDDMKEFYSEEGLKKE